MDGGRGEGRDGERWSVRMEGKDRGMGARMKET